MTTPEQNKKIINYLMPYQPTKIGVFGSYARGENKADSDLDLIVSLNEKMGIIKYTGIWQGLEDLLGIKIDLLTEKQLESANQIVRESIKKDIQIIYE